MKPIRKEVKMRIKVKKINNNQRQKRNRIQISLIYHDVREMKHLMSCLEKSLDPELLFK
jgi:hypothetical protein